MAREAGETSPARKRHYGVWRTADVAEPERYAYFREAVCEAFMDLSPEHDRAGPFDATVESIPLAQGAVNRVRGTPHHVRRTRAQIGRSSEQCYFLNLQLESECTIEQGAGRCGSRRARWRCSRATCRSGFSIRRTRT